MEKEVITTNLKKLAKLIETYRLERDKNQLKEASYFNPLHFLKTDETGLSTILAFLLNPEEKHGQRDLFLNSFLRMIKKPEFLAYDRAIVRTEVTTFNSRRHDIFIEGWIRNERKWIISIENKLRWASDQKDQMKDYAEDLKKYDVPFCLLYLSVFGDMPASSSISEKMWLDLGSKVRVLSAENLIEWLDQTPIVAERIVQFSEDIKNFLREDVMGIEVEDKFIDEILNDVGLLKSSLIVINSQRAIYDRLLKNFIEQLNSKINNSLFIAKSIGDYNKRYFQIVIVPKN